VVERERERERERDRESEREGVLRLGEEDNPFGEERKNSVAAEA